MANFIFTDSKELATLAPDLDHPDLDRLAEYIGYLHVYNTEETRDAILADNLTKWAYWEEETYYGTHATEDDFMDYFWETYGGEPILSDYTVTQGNHYYADLY